MKTVRCDPISLSLSQIYRWKIRLFPGCNIVLSLSTSSNRRELFSNSKYNQPRNENTNYLQCFSPIHTPVSISQEGESREPMYTKIIKFIYEMSPSMFTKMIPSTNRNLENKLIVGSNSSIFPFTLEAGYDRSRKQEGGSECSNNTRFTSR